MLIDIAPGDKRNLHGREELRPNRRIPDGSIHRLPGQADRHSVLAANQ